jgi:processive 1,2-diacylglycerol beta-glucosyltransferase
MKKIIIAYASAGAGHHKAAEAIYNCFKKKLPDSEVLLVDVLEKSKPFFKNTYINGYYFMVNKAIWLWSLLFWITGVKFLRFLVHPFFLALDHIYTREFARFLVKEQPDAIISTHFLPPEIATYLKAKQKINSKIITVITDFGVHPFWIAKGVDCYIAASSITKEKLTNMGVRKEIIFDSGIPTDPKFATPLEKTDLRKRFGLAPEALTVLITTGSFGIGPVEEIVDELYTDTQIIVICAKNKPLYENLKAKNYPNVLVFGFVDNIEECMAASDIVIAKPGGLTTSEILCLDLVPIFIWPIPGQETNNIKVMQEYGIGKYAKSVRDVKDAVLDYKAHPDKILEIKDRIKKIKKPLAAEDVCNALR